MPEQRLDALARTPAQSTSRRSVMRGMAAVGGGLGALAGRGRQATAAPRAQDAGGGVSLLYVQAATSGALAAGSTPGTNDLTLDGAGRSSACFADRPSRPAGQAPTHLILDAPAFESAVPPNAALTAAPGGRESVTIVELMAARYDDARR